MIPGLVYQFIYHATTFRPRYRKADNAGGRKGDGISQARKGVLEFPEQSIQ